jgi:peptidoglycan/LPS O-acetylase OafA/YrhL
VRGATPARAPHLPEIDRLKGAAILCVLLIHARPFADLRVHEILINRAVPVLVCLFGMTSSLWWERASTPFIATTRSWFETRFLRLMIPVWGMLALWWPMQFVLWDAALKEPRFIVATFLGYMPWIGAGWFVTLVVELVLLFPFIYWGFTMLGPIASTAIALASTLLSHRFPLHVIGFSQTLLLHSAPFEPFFYWWIFPPAYLWHLCAGMILARRWRAGSGRLAGLSLALFAAATVVHQRWPEAPLLRTGLPALADVPLTVLLLYALARVAPRSCVDRALTWLGLNSWGVYLGHLVVLNWFWLLEYEPQEGPIAGRVLYVGVLLVGAIVLVRVGTPVRSVVERCVRALFVRSGAP